MSFEGRKLETNRERPMILCQTCKGKGTTGDSPNNVRMCQKCGGKGKVPAPK